MSELNKILPFGIVIEIPHDSTIADGKEKSKAHAKMQEDLTRLILDDAKSIMDKINLTLTNCC